MDKVLHTQELLELFLLHTDMRTLLTACQRVNRGWAALISSSPALQKKLFFLPDHRPIIADAALDRWERSALEERECINPLLSQSFEEWFNPTDPAGSAFLGLADLKKQPFAKNIEAFAHPRATWREMLVQQRPPITTVAIWTTSGFDYFEWLQFFKVHGDTADEADRQGRLEGLRMAPYLTFCMQWAGRTDRQIAKLWFAHDWHDFFRDDDEVRLCEWSKIAQDRSELFLTRVEDSPGRTHSPSAEYEEDGSFARADDQWLFKLCNPLLAQDSRLGRLVVTETLEEYRAS